MSRLAKAGFARLENKRLIQRYIDRLDMTQRKFADSIGVGKHVLSNVLNGKSHNVTVLDSLRRIGVPEDLLCDPRREEPAAEPVPGVKKLFLGGNPKGIQIGLKISQRAIARACGVSAATISQIMKRGKYPKRGAVELRQSIIALLVTHGTAHEIAERQVPQIDKAA